MYNPTIITQPQFTKQLFNGIEKECIVVKVEGPEYEECERASQGDNFWANSKKGVYGAGLGATDDDEFKPVRTGLLGQMAFGKLTGLPVDTEYRPGGDHHDNLICNKKFDMKCAMRNRGNQLIYHTSERGKRIPLDKDVYVCSYVEEENRAAKTATIIMTGFALRNQVGQCEVKQGKGEHLNYVLFYDTLRPIKELINLVNQYTALNERKI